MTADEHRISAETLAALEHSGALRRLRVQYRSNPVVFEDALALSRAALRWQITTVGADANELAVTVTPAASSELLTTDQVGALLGVSPNTVRWACRERRLRGERIADRWFISPDEVARYAVKMRGTR